MSLASVIQRDPPPGWKVEPACPLTGGKRTYQASGVDGRGWSLMRSGFKTRELACAWAWPKAKAKAIG